MNMLNILASAMGGFARIARIVLIYRIVDNVNLTEANFYGVMNASVVYFSTIPVTLL